ncbi:MAG TPA: RagB/SusD family nutrient uptake outer membrane protein [Puia sp.]|nr:RagB/SusD family nutrient uptake outer membrane protein [Puia sp.]
MNKLFLACISIVLLAGCSKHVLDTQPNNSYTEDTYWTSDKNALAYLSGCYQALMFNGVYGYATPLWEETATPNAYDYGNSDGFSLIALGTQNATNTTTGNIVTGIISSRWTDAYGGVGRCNTLLANIDKVPVLDTALRARMKAETKFLRALFYTLLETYYGDVPLILDEPDLAGQANLSRTPRLQVVAQILKDLNEAAPELPAKYSGSDIGRATKGAALGLMARVLLFEASPLNNSSGDVSKWAQAAAAAQAVMNLSDAGYGLFPNYRSLFLPANENKQETVFDVQYSLVSPGLGNSFDLIDRSYNTNAPLLDLVNAYQCTDGLPIDQSPLYDAAHPYANRDPRMSMTIVYPGARYLGAVTTANSPFQFTGYGVKKYSIYDSVASTNLINQAGKSETNYMVIRYADILLMYAEAQNEATGPDASVYDAVKQVRLRAGMPELPAGLTQAQMRDAIHLERRVEFACEGFYYNDIRRWKTAEQVMNATIYNSQGQPIVQRSFDANRDYWWPVPQPQRDLDPNLSQNINY